VDRDEEPVARVERSAEAEDLTAPAVRFVPAVDCDGIGGTWRGQAYSAPHAGYYEFTLQVAQPAFGDHDLTGSIVARSWEGTPAEVVPPETCDGRYHWTVVEGAAGRVDDDGSFSFGGTSWAVGEHLCGDEVTDYSLDKLTTVVADTDSGHVTRMTGVLTDSVVWTGAGLPIELTRVACD
jgi:hypothetical protein